MRLEEADKNHEIAMWEKFRKVGLLWFVNRIIHLFGWAIVYYYGDGDELQKVTVENTDFRGFDSDTDRNGYVKLTNYMSEVANQLCDVVAKKQ